MTEHFLATILSALIATTTFGASGALAQDAAARIREPQIESPSAPDWPPGLDEWETPPWDPEGNPNEAEARGLISPEVQENDAEGPTEQGTRTTETFGDEEEEQDLYELLARVRASPPGIDGEPIPRPNPLASEPAKEMDPMQPEDVILFREGYIE